AGTRPGGGVGAPTPPPCPILSDETPLSMLEPELRAMAALLAGQGVDRRFSLPSPDEAPSSHSDAEAATSDAERAAFEPEDLDDRASLDGGRAWSPNDEAIGMRQVGQHGAVLAIEGGRDEASASVMPQPGAQIILPAVVLGD